MNMIGNKAEWLNIPSLAGENRYSSKATNNNKKSDHRKRICF